MGSDLVDSIRNAIAGKDDEQEKDLLAREILQVHMLASLVTNGDVLPTALLTVQEGNVAPKRRVQPVMDLDGLSDMSRMSGPSCWADAIGSSRGRTSAANEQRPFLRLSAPVSPTGLTRARISTW
jgi:hypothetical protein